MARRKHTRTTQVQEVNSLNATRKAEGAPRRNRAQEWAAYLAANPDMAQRYRSTRLAATE